MRERDRERERGTQKDDKCIQDIEDRDAYGKNVKDALYVYIYIYLRIYRDEGRPRI